MKAVVMAADLREQMVADPPAGFEHTLTPVKAVHVAFAGAGWRIPEPEQVDVDLAAGTVTCLWRMQEPYSLAVRDGVDSLRGRLLQALERGGVPPESLSRMTEDVIGALDAWLLGQGVPDPVPIRSPQDLRGVPVEHHHR